MNREPSLAARFHEAHDSVLCDHPQLRPLSSFGRFQTTVGLLADQVQAGAHVLDVGAWPGLLTACLARCGFQVTAVDKAPHRSVTWSREVLLDAAGLPSHVGELTFDALCAGEGVSVIAADIEREPLPLASNTVDAVLLTEVIEHLWSDPIFALREINRVLKQGTGVLVLSTPNLMSLRNRVNFLLGHVDRVIEHPFVSFLKAQRVGHLGHCRLYAPDELRGMLFLLGFHSSCIFTEFNHQTSEGVPVESSRSAVSDSRRPASRRSLATTFFRSPTSYWHAAVATSLAIAERAVPRWRPQVFVIAHKEMDADFDQNHPGETRELVERNRLRSFGPDAR